MPWAVDTASRMGGWPHRAFVLAAYFGQDLRTFKGAYRRAEIADLWRDYLAAHDTYPVDEPD